jgi:asparagine synthase (glutamine-hydrolysing)
MPYEGMLLIVRSMGRWMIHRGPDAWGDFADDVVALGHNRLSIIDLATGHQPMSSLCGRYTIVFNGEIYNHVDLRRSLRHAGMRFGTDHSDTEVILNGFALWGDGVFGRLAGMFALAIWDALERRLVLARDRMGIKPLYYASLPGGGLAFASEPKAIVGAGLVKAELREDGVAEFLFFRAPLGENSLFSGIHKLPPGHLLQWCRQSGLMRPKPFSQAQPAEPFRSDSEAIDAVEFALSSAVESHLQADVPVGSFLSGGVDSSLVTALASKGRSIDAFTIGSDSRWDETEFASTVATHLGAPHHVRRLVAEDYLSFFGDWQYVNDDPCADPSALALMMLSEFARSAGMKVMLAGEGSDELFGGYNSYSRFVSLDFVRAVPGAPLAVRPLLGLMDRRSRDYMSLGTSSFLGTGHLADVSLLKQVMSPSRSGDLVRIMQLCSSPVPGRSALRRAMELDQRTRLPDDLLARTDRASMYFSIEVRVPFLDNHVVDCAARLTDSQCIGRFARSNKRILKELAERYVPRSAIYRPKRGFDLPLGDWLRHRFMPVLQSFVGEERVTSLDYRAIGRVVQDLQQGRDSHAGFVWAWLILESWHRLWIEGSSEPRIPSAVRALEGYRSLHE